jgi:hypothetical protein
MKAPSETIPVGVRSIPIIAHKRNFPSFIGFEFIASLPAFIIRDFELSFKGFDLYRDRTRVTRIHYWQEGYIDEPYSRDMLSYGVRLQIDANHLHEIVERYGLQLCTKEDEERQYFKSKYHQEADEKSNGTRIEVFV